MSHSQFHCTARVYLDMHGLIFETSICYWQDQPGSRATGHDPTGPARRRRPGKGQTGKPSEQAREREREGAGTAAQLLSAARSGPPPREPDSRSRRTAGRG